MQLKNKSKTRKNKKPKWPIQKFKRLVTTKSRQVKIGLSIFGSIRFWTKINNQTEFFYLFFEPNRTENRFKPINFGSVRFGFFPFQTGSNRNYSNLFTVPKKSLRRRRQLKIFLVWAFWCSMPRPPTIKTRASKSKASATHNKEKMSCLLAETCMNKYVQTLSHTSQQKIRNTTGKKRGGWKEKKNQLLWHLTTSYMHLIKPVTLGL